MKMPPLTCALAEVDDVRGLLKYVKVVDGTVVASTAKEEGLGNFHVASSQHSPTYFARGSIPFPTGKQKHWKAPLPPSVANKFFLWVKVILQRCRWPSKKYLQ